MMGRRTVAAWVVCSCLGLAAWVPVPQGEDAEALMQADRDFARATAERGIEGWMSYMAEDAARMPAPGGEFIRGHDAIRSADSPLIESEEVALVWEPTAAHLFGDGATGVTTGDYRLVRRDDEATVGCGSYVSFWRHGAAGWKVLFDTGVQSTDPC